MIDLQALNSVAQVQDVEIIDIFQAFAIPKGKCWLVRERKLITFVLKCTH